VSGLSEEKHKAKSLKKTPRHSKTRAHDPDGGRHVGSLEHLCGGALGTCSIAAPRARLLHARDRIAAPGGSRARADPLSLLLRAMSPCLGETCARATARTHRSAAARRPGHPQLGPPSPRCPLPRWSRGARGREVCFPGGARLLGSGLQVGVRRGVPGGEPAAVPRPLGRARPGCSSRRGHARGSGPGGRRVPGSGSGTAAWGGKGGARVLGRALRLHRPGCARPRARDSSPVHLASRRCHQWAGTAPLSLELPKGRILRAARNTACTGPAGTGPDPFPSG
jgi:hypothetical protein